MTIKKILTGDEVNFEYIYSLLEFISSIRQYNYHFPPHVGRQLQKYNRLENISDDIERRVYMDRLNQLVPYSEKQKKELKARFKLFLESNAGRLIDNKNYFKLFNMHPAASIFIKTVVSNNLYVTHHDFDEKYSMDKVTAFINHFNFVFDQQGYKDAVEARLVHVIKNINSASEYLVYQKSIKSTHTIRFCLGFNSEIDHEYDRGFENEINKKYSSDDEMRDFRLKALVKGRDAIFRYGKKNKVMKYIDGYMWKIDFCSIRGYYIHVFLFLNENWRSSFDIIEEMGNIWRGAVSNGDIFLYGGGRRSFRISVESDYNSLLLNISRLFNQDVLAYVDTTLSDGKKLRIFGKGLTV